MIDQRCKPACDFRCNSAPELDLECEACPGRNPSKPMPGGGGRPRWRLVKRMYSGNFLIHPWRDVKVNLDIISAVCFRAKGTAWIQFERKNGMC